MHTMSKQNNVLFIPIYKKITMVSVMNMESFVVVFYTVETRGQGVEGIFGSIYKSEPATIYPLSFLFSLHEGVNYRKSLAYVRHTTMTHSFVCWPRYKSTLNKYTFYFVLLSNRHQTATLRYIGENIN